MKKVLVTFTFSFGSVKTVKKDSLIVRFWLNETLLCDPCWRYGFRIFIVHQRDNPNHDVRRK